MIRNKPRKKRTKIVHDQCQWLVAPSGPHIGLYCSDHRQWIKWLNPEERSAVSEIPVTKLDKPPQWMD